MEYTDTGFRAVYHNFAVFPLTDGIRAAMKGFPGEEYADSVLTYGYYDGDAGITLEVLAAAKSRGDSFVIADGQDHVSSKIRIGAVAEEEFSVLEPDDSLLRKFGTKLEMLKAYDAPEDVEKSRTFDFLDDVRDPERIDDVRVFLEKDGLEPELCPARITGLGDHEIRARLLSEPEQDFGVHEGEEFPFHVRQDEKTGRVTCHAAAGSAGRIDPRILEDGTLLREAIRRFRDAGDRDAFIRVLMVLRDSFVWIPCTAVTGEEDRKTLEQLVAEAGDDLNSLVGKTFTSRQNIRMVPDILQKDGEFFFPVFSAEEEMGEYGKRFSKIRDRFTNVIRLARNKKHEGKELAGIAVNAFSAPFIVPKGLFEFVEKLPSRVKADPEENA